MMRAICDVLAEFNGNELTLVEPGGNLGDTLIYRGLEKYLDEEGFRYGSINYQNSLQSSFSHQIKRGINKATNRVSTHLFTEIPTTNGPILIHGGGNFNDIWGSGIKIFENLIQTTSNPIIVGPQTYLFLQTNFEKLVEDTEQPIHLFCREEYSYSKLQNLDLPRNIQLHKSDDTALNLDRSDLEKELHNSNPPELPSEKYVLFAFRHDKEAVTSASSKLGATDHNMVSVVEDISNSADQLSDFIHYVNSAERIHTDRLHVSILASVLETKVTLYENIYYKNRGVYKYSMSGDNNVDFEDAV